ncbi:unnamed protein product [Bursaphelenchus xylophilus]|uniref:(pine wood nematode) hypothetical protein n=1 Tax=Bursaphelenchus xylophilus TaxID=6326 RepID=A0A1I7S9K0_BURXY|nr:unnamed protein product [Bursaphelenchus xylophilus]CAG9111176.1 unnamed protein product [Bursaphelenchus xylophilus]
MLAKSLLHRELNVAITSILILLTLYISLCSILQKSLYNPLDEGISSLLPIFNGSHLNPLEETKPQVSSTATVMALFFLWAIAMVFGQVMTWLRLPPLLGMLLAGMLVKNVEFFSPIQNIDADWDSILRSLAFLLILIRCGLNLDPDVLKKSLAIFSSLGFISTTIEAIAVVLASYYLFGISLPLAILFSFVLTSTSPAVTVPSMIRLQAHGRGTEKGIPTMILAAASIDNIYCITAFSITAAVFFGGTGNDDLTLLIIRIVVEVTFAVVSGIIFGLLLCVFPRVRVRHAHFIRSVIISSFSTAIFFAAKSTGHTMIGPISVFIMVVVASIKWERDNPKKTKKEEKCFKIIWDDVLQPFLFALIGLVFDFSQINWDVFWSAMAIIFIGAAIRVIAVFAMSIFMALSFKERIFISICFFPKATVQAALAPFIIQYATGNDDRDKSKFLFNTCVLSILATAPVGQLLIDLLGKYLLEKEVRLAERETDSSKVESFEEFEVKPQVIQVEKDNTLRVKVVPIDN